MPKAPTINTKRLTIREARVSDAPFLHQSIGLDPEMSQYTGWNPYETLEAAEAKLTADLCDESESYSWTIDFEGRPVGIVGAYDFREDECSYEIGYSVFRAYWGKGFAREAVGAVVAFLRDDMGFGIRAWADSKNEASVRVLKGLGFTLLGEEDGCQHFSLKLKSHPFGAGKI